MTHSAAADQLPPREGTAAVLGVASRYVGEDCIVCSRRFAAGQTIHVSTPGVRHHAGPCHERANDGCAWGDWE
jgi:hypothetical protein